MEINEVYQQGEVNFMRIAELPIGEDLVPVTVSEKGYILAHSESGNHHLLTGGEVLERPARFTGLARMYAILKEPQQAIQDAASPHEAKTLEAGIYEITISREFNPFLQLARKVSD